MQNLLQINCLRIFKKNSLYLILLSRTIDTWPPGRSNVPKDKIEINCSAIVLQWSQWWWQWWRGQWGGCLGPCWWAGQTGAWLGTWPGYGNSTCIQYNSKNCHFKNVSQYFHIRNLNISIQFRVWILFFLNVIKYASTVIYIVKMLKSVSWLNGKEFH